MEVDGGSYASKLHTEISYIEMQEVVPELVTPSVPTLITTSSDGFQEHNPVTVIDNNTPPDEEQLYTQPSPSTDSHSAIGESIINTKNASDSSLTVTIVNNIHTIGDNDVLEDGKRAGEDVVVTYLEPKKETEPFQQPPVPKDDSTRDEVVVVKDTVVDTESEDEWNSTAIPSATSEVMAEQRSQVREVQ